jgi:hypothetical protein
MATAFFMCGLAAAWAGPVSPEGLELVNFEVKAPDPAKIGDEVLVSFTLKNVGAKAVEFHKSFGVLVAARRMDERGKKLNRDFGHQRRGYKLGPGQSLEVKARLIFDMLGTWTFWPAYNAQGAWGPFDTYKKTIQVAKSAAPLATLKSFQGGGGKTVVLWQGKKLPLQVFPPDNPWNQDISKLPRHPDSDQLLANIGKHTSLHPDFGSGQGWKVLGYALRRSKSFGIPYVTVRAGQKRVPVKFRWAAESDPGPYPIPPDAPIEGDGKGDAHVIVLDYDAKKLYEMWAAKKLNGGWQVGSGAVFDLTSNKLRPLGWTSADAAGLPIFPGLVRYEEVFDLGEIRHALRFTAQKTRRAYIKPATHFASTVKSPLRPPLGLRVRLKKDFDIEPFPEPVKVVLRALKKYGMFLADNGGDWFISGVPHPRWDDDTMNWLKKVKGKDLEAVYTGEIITD